MRLCRSNAGRQILLKSLICNARCASDASDASDAPDRLGKTGCI